MLKGVDAQKNAALRQQDDAQLFNASLDAGDSAQLQRLNRKNTGLNGQLDGAKLLADYAQRNGSESTAVNTDPAKALPLLPEKSAVAGSQGLPMRTDNAEYKVVEIPQSKIDEISSYIDTVDNATAKKKYKRILKNLFMGQTFKNVNTVIDGLSYEIGISSKGIGEIIARQPVNADTLAMLEQLNDVVENAKFMASEPSRHIDSRIKRTDLFETDTKFGDSHGVTRMRVNVSDNGNKLYFATSKKTETSDSQPRGGTPRQRGVESDASVATSITDSAGKSNSNFPDGTGAASRGFAGESFGNDTALTQTHSTNPMYTEAERAIPGLRPEDSTHQVHHDRDVDYQAQERLESDYDGEKQDLFFHKQSWDDVDQNLALRIIANEVARARETGDYSEVVRLQRENEARGTEQGQALRQRKRFADSAAGIVAKAATDLSDAQRTRNITEQEKNSVMQDVARYAEEWENIPQGEVSRVIDLIKELNATRKTGGFFNGKKTSGTLSKALDAVAAQEGGSRWISCD